MKHLLSITDLSKARIQSLLDRAEVLLRDVVKKNRQLDTLSGRVVTNLFFEPSTRTQFSFTVAAFRLGAYVLNPTISNISTVKGETLLDTVKAFTAMGTQLFVVRHNQEKTNEWLAQQIENQAVIVNGGDGCHQHPTQALLDLLTIRQYKGDDFKALTVAIIGDIAHSRVARSLIQAFRIMGCNQIRLIAPSEFLPAEVEDWQVSTYQSMPEGLSNVDVIMTLRIQHERMQAAAIPHPDKFFNQYGLTPQHLSFAKPDAIVMHPGPMNQGIEIEASVANGQQSVIFEQITNGVAMRMAVIEWLLTHHE